MKYELIRYVVGGICTTLVNIGAFYGFRKLLGMPIVFANLIFILTAILFAFFVNKKFVFRVEGKNDTEKQFIRFVGMRGITFVVELFGVEWLVFGIHFPEMWAKFSIQFLVIAMNYVISKWFVFADGRKKDGENNSHSALLE